MDVKTFLLKNLTMGATINNESLSTEPPPLKGQQPKPLGGGGFILLAPKIFALYSVVVKAQKMLSSHGGFLTIAINIEKQPNQINTL